jgi:hypothetical protein
MSVLVAVVVNWSNGVDFAQHDKHGIHFKNFMSKDVLPLQIILVTGMAQNLFSGSSGGGASGVIGQPIFSSNNNQQD